MVAVLLREPEADTFSSLLIAASPVISAGSLIELHRVMTLRRGLTMRREIDDLLSQLQMEVASFDRAQADLAAEGQQRFGKGRRDPPAVLNFGDLFAYALARHLDAPLLFKGDDFSKTDVKPAMAG